MEINKDLIAASSTPIVLAILAEADSYGYAILQRVRELSGGRMEWTDGMLYPVLHRLERLGHVEGRGGGAGGGRRAPDPRVSAAGAAAWGRGGKSRRAAAVASTTGLRPGAGLSSRRNEGSGKRWTLRCGASGRRPPHPSRPATPPRPRPPPPAPARAGVRA